MNDNRRRAILIGGLIALLVLLPFVVVGVRIASDLRSRAGNEGIQPQRVILSNITSNSITVSYVTTEATTGQATASGGTSGIVTGLDSRDIQTSTPGSYKIHYVVINNLQPNTSYEVAISSGGQVFTDAAWTVSTFPVSDQLTTPNSVLVSVTPTITEGIVYAIAGNASGNSTVASSFASQSNSTIQKNNMLSTTGQAISNFDDKDIVVFVEAGDIGRGQVQFTGTSQRAPSITLSTAPITFNPKQTITIGSTGTPTPNPTPTPPASTPTSGPVTTPNLDPISKGLLTQLFSTGAERTNPIAPYNVFISNLTQSNFTINWLTKEPTIGYIEFVNPDGSRVQIKDQRDISVENAKKRFTHSVRYSGGNLVANTIGRFQIVSNEVRFGKDIAAVASEYNKQFKDFASLRLNPLTEQPLGSSGANPTPTSSPTVDLNTFTFVQPAATLTDYFSLVTPVEPGSAPAPYVMQGLLTTAISSSAYQAALQVASNLNADAANTGNPASPKLTAAAVDTERDFLVAGKTSNSLWAASVPSSSLSYSLSLGSTLNDLQKNFIEPTGSTNVSIRIFGYLNQTGSKEVNFTSEQVDLNVTDPGAVLSAQHATIIQTKSFTGMGKGRSPFTLKSTAAEEIGSVTNSNNWQLTSKVIAEGINELTFVFSDTNSISYLFIYEPPTGPDLPATDLPSEFWLLVIGVVLLATGITLRRKYLVVK